VRSGVTLVEILVASAVLAALIVPLLNLFSSTTRRVGTEMAFMQATLMADEVLAQVDAVHQRLGRLEVVPGPDHVGGKSPDGELDVETYLRTFTGEDNVILLPSSPEDARGSRLHLSHTQRGFRRFLKITALRTADARRNLATDVLWQARARVEYDVVLDSKKLTREAALSSCYFEKCRPDGKFRIPQ